MDRPIDAVRPHVQDLAPHSTRRQWREVDNSSARPTPVRTPCEQDLALAPNRAFITSCAHPTQQEIIQQERNMIDSDTAPVDPPSADLTPWQQAVLATALNSNSGYVDWLPPHIVGAARDALLNELQERALITRIESGWVVTDAGCEAMHYSAASSRRQALLAQIGNVISIGRTPKMLEFFGAPIEADELDVQLPFKRKPANFAS